MANDVALQAVIDAAAALKAEGVSEGQAAAQQAYFGRSAIRLTIGIFAAALQQGAAQIQPFSPDAAAFLLAKAKEFAEFASPPTVTSVSPAANAANVQPTDQVVLGFSAPLNPASVSDTCIFVAPTNGGPHLTGDLHYDGVTTVTFVPANGFTAGVDYTITVSANVKSKVGQIMGTDWTSSFTVAAA